MTSSRKILVQPSWNHTQSIQSTTSLAWNVKSSPWTISVAWNSMTFNLVCTKVNLFSSLDILSAPKFKGLKVYLSSISAIFKVDNECICYVNVWKKVLHSQFTFFDGLKTVDTLRFIAMLKNRWVFMNYLSSLSFQNIRCHWRSYDFDQAMTYFC